MVTGDGSDSGMVGEGMSRRGMYLTQILPSSEKAGICRILDRMKLFSLWTGGSSARNPEQKGTGTSESSRSSKDRGNTNAVDVAYHGSKRGEIIGGQILAGDGCSPKEKTRPSPAGPVHIFGIRRPQKTTTHPIFQPGPSVAGPSSQIDSKSTSATLDQLLDRVAALLNPSTPIAREVRPEVA